MYNAKNRVQLFHTIQDVHRLKGQTNEWFNILLWASGYTRVSKYNFTSSDKSASLYGKQTLYFKSMDNFLVIFDLDTQGMAC